MCKISVIVPVYNVEEFLKECVDSILRQTYKDFELILVNDGSKDNSGKMCDEFALTDDRIKVIHKVNGGLSSARNAGIVESKGEFLMFVDSDDYVSEDCLECMINAYEQYGGDVVTTRYTEDEKKISDFNGKIKAYTSKEALKLLLKDKLSTSAGAKLFRRGLFDTIRFPEGMIYEDYATIPKVFQISSKIISVEKYTYYYRVNLSSITRAKFNPKRMQFFDVADMINASLREIDPKLIKYSTARHVRYAISFYSQIGKDDFKDSEIEAFLVRFIRTNIMRYCFTSRFSIFSKAYGCLIAISPKLSKKFSRII